MVPGSPCIRRNPAGMLSAGILRQCSPLLPTFWGSDASLPEVRSPPAGPLLLQILLASREQMGYLPLRAARCAMPESPVGPRPCVACRTGDSCRSCSGAALFLPMVRRSGARSFAYRPGCPGRTGAGMTRERPGKSGFSGREQKKHCLLLRLGIWTFDCVREVAAWGR